MGDRKTNATLLKAAREVELSTRYDETHAPGSLANPQRLAEAKLQLQRIDGLQLLEALLEARRLGFPIGL